LSSHGSLKSANQGLRVNRDKTSPIKWEETGGEVVKMASYLNFENSLIPAAIAEGSQVIWWSGVDIRSLIKCLNLWAMLGFKKLPFWIAPLVLSLGAFVAFI
jgi:hypothetical protein